MRDHRHAAGARDPAHRIAERGPAVRHIARPAIDEVASKHLVRAGADPRLDKMTREMRARDQRRVAGMAQRTLEAARYAGPRQTVEPGAAAGADF